MVEQSPIRRFILHRGVFRERVQLYRETLKAEENELIPVLESIFFFPLPLMTRVRGADGSWMVLPVLSYCSVSYGAKQALFSPRYSRYCMLVSHVFFEKVLHSYREAKPYLLCATLNHYTVLCLQKRLTGFEQMQKLTYKLLEELYGIRFPSNVTPTEETVTFHTLRFLNQKHGVGLLAHCAYGRVLTWKEWNHLKKAVKKTRVGRVIKECYQRLKKELTERKHTKQRCA